MFKKLSAIFLIIVLILNDTSSIKLRISPLEKSLLPSNSLKSILNQMLQDANNSTQDDPKTFTDLIDKIKGIMDNLKLEQEKHTETMTKMDGQCKGEIAFRDVESSAAKDSLERSVKAKEDCDNSGAAGLTNMNDLTEAKKKYGAELDRITKQRDEENKLYNERKSELTQAISFTNDFVKRLENMDFKDTTTFIQKSEKLLRHVSNAGGLIHTVPILIAISQFASAPNKFVQLGQSTDDQENIDKLGNTLLTLVKNLEDSAKANEDGEAENFKNFTAYKTNITDLINKTEANVKLVEAHLADMNACSLSEDAISGQARAKYERNHTLKQNAQDMCSKFKEEFESASKDRYDQILTVDQILKILNSKFQRRSLALEQYLATVKKGWQDYMNSSQFTQFEDYKQKAVEKNDRGADLATTKQSA